MPGPTAAAPAAGVAASPPPHTAAASSSSWRLPVLLLSLCWCLCFSVLTACAATLNLAGALFSDSAYHTLPLALTTFSSGLYNLLLPCELRRLGRWRAYLLGATLGSVGGLTCCMPQGSNPVTSRQGTRQACYSHV